MLSGLEAERQAHACARWVIRRVVGIRIGVRICVRVGRWIVGPIVPGSIARAVIGTATVVAAIVDLLDQTAQHELGD
ncbi:MAG: hypothetical protein ACXW1R_08645 [Halobacteriota archaeon]